MVISIEVITCGGKRQDCMRCEQLRSLEQNWKQKDHRWRVSLDGLSQLLTLTMHGLSNSALR